MTERRRPRRLPRSGRPVSWSTPRPRSALPLEVAHTPAVLYW